MSCLAEVVPVMFLGVQKMSFLALMKIPEDTGLEKWQEEEVVLQKMLVMLQQPHKESMKTIHAKY